MPKALMAAALACLALASAARAENLSVVPQGGRVADLVRVPAGAEMAYVAGQTADATAAGAPPRDTQAQTVNVLGKIQRLLEAQGFSLEDVVMMRVALVGDPAKGGAMDFAGMNAGYAQFFGATRHKPARMTTRAAALVDPGALVEIEVQAAKGSR
jgi:enamine deaminase RidA (YjgF/YER057c/UK114 family)